MFLQPKAKRNLTENIYSMMLASIYIYIRINYTWVFRVKCTENQWFQIMCCDKCISIRYTVDQKATAERIVMIDKLTS